MKKRRPNVDGGVIGNGASGEEVDCARDEVIVDEEEAKEKVMEVNDAEALEEGAEVAEQTGDANSGLDHFSLSRSLYIYTNLLSLFLREFGFSVILCEKVKEMRME